MNRNAPVRRRRGVAADFDSMSVEKIGVRRFDWRDPYHLAVTLGWPGFFALLLALYVALNLLFALLYAAVPGSVTNVRPGSLSDAFFFSVQTLATVGYGVMAPQTLYGHVVSSVETFVGLVFTAMMTGLVFVRFSRPKAKILFADQAVVTRAEGGRRQLMIRIGNGRLGPLLDASARVTMLVPTRNAGGQVFRRAIDLALVRADMPFFPLTWTLIHELDERSVLREALAGGEARRHELRLMVSVTARDPSLDATVSSLKTYDADALQLDAHYVDAVRWDGENHTVADLGKLSAIEPDAAPGAPGA